MFQAALVVFFLIKLCCPTNGSIFEYIKTKYDEDELNNVRKYERTLKSLRKSLLDVDFLTRCKVYNTIPKFLRFRLYKRALERKKFYSSWQSKLLNQELSFKNKQVQDLELELSNSLQILRDRLSFLDFHRVKKVIDGIVSRQISKMKITQDRKLQHLQINNELKPLSPDKVVLNFSSVELSQRLKFILAFGLDFCLPVYKLNFIQYFHSFETLLHRLKTSESIYGDFQSFKRQFSDNCLSFFHGFKPYKVFSAIITRKDIQMIKNFATNKNVIVTRPDKGNAVVIFDKSKYIHIMENIISDTSKFVSITDPIDKYTQKIEDKINRFLNKMKNFKIIPEEVYSQLYISGSAPGILYGTPKVHKPDFAMNPKFRPIFASYNTPSYNLSKFLVPILSKFTQNQYTVTNSYDFADEITKVENRNYFMASFDVENLFTNVPLDETSNIFLNKLFDGVDRFMNFSREQFKTMLELSVKNSFFLFNEKLYRQVDGVGMGLPQGPIYGNGILAHHEDQWLDKCPLSFKPVMYKRYVDDSFILFRQRSHAALFLDYLNKQHPKLKFTMEEESENSLPFLDVLVSKHGNKFQTSVFRKKTFTGLGSSFFSCCDRIFKINAVKTLLSRCYKVCSSWNAIDLEINFLRKFFNDNGFPAFIFNNCVNRFLNSKFDVDAIPPNVPKKSVYASIPYFGSQSVKLKEKIISLVSKYYPYVNLKLISVNHNKIQTYFNYKDRLPKCSRFCVIYKFSCPCAQGSYIGMTKRPLRTRIAEHAGISPRTGNLIQCPSHSEIRNHVQICNNSIDENNFEILSNPSNPSDLRILESLHIYKNKPNLNNQYSSFPLEIIGN